jgi:hypothetical protein
MAEYALLINGEFKEIRQYTERPQDIEHKDVRWYPVVREYGPEEKAHIQDDYWLIVSIDPATIPPPVPLSITPRQARLILLQQGLLPYVEKTILEQDEATRITWEYASEFRRDDPLLTGIAKNLNLTDEQIDQFFIEAAKL